MTQIPVNQAPSVAGSMPDTPPAPKPEQVRLLAAQFESMLLGQMLKGMRESMFDDAADTGFGGGPLTEALFTELTQVLSRAGGLGLGQALVDPLSREVVTREGQTSALADALAAPALQALNPGGLSLTSGREGASFAIAPAAGLSQVQIQGRVSSAYGWREDPLDGARKFHRGTDIALAHGTDVPSARAGTVTFAGSKAGYGLTVEVDHGGQTTRYAHLSEIRVEVGQSVAAGQVIAKSGATGRATGPHLHFEVIEEGQAIDPSGFLAGPDAPR